VALAQANYQVEGVNTTGALYAAYVLLGLGLLFLVVAFFLFQQLKARLSSQAKSLFTSNAKALF
jgi:hypothetical protein